MVLSRISKGYSPQMRGGSLLSQELTQSHCHDKLLCSVPKYIYFLLWPPYQLSAFFLLLQPLKCIIIVCNIRLVQWMTIGDVMVIINRRPVCGDILSSILVIFIAGCMFNLEVKGQDICKGCSSWPLKDLIATISFLPACSESFTFQNS